ncbi:MAG: hypothetical protein RSB39_07810 [Oscillospiraceae bacterium]
MDKKYSSLSLSGGTFNAFKADFDQMLRKTLSAMIQKDGEKAEVKVSVKITLYPGFTPDLSGAAGGHDREVIMPMFEHKVSTVIQYKDEKSGITGGSEYELFFDKDVNDYVMRPIDNGQASFFDESKEAGDSDEDGGYGMDYEKPGTSGDSEGVAE